MPPVNTTEKKVLEKEGHHINEVISSQSEVARFESVVSAAGFMSDQEVTGTVFEKVARIMKAVKSHIVTQPTQLKVTEKFKEFVNLLQNDLKLDDLAEHLRVTLAKMESDHTTKETDCNAPSPDEIESDRTTEETDCKTPSPVKKFKEDVNELHDNMMVDQPSQDKQETAHLKKLYSKNEGKNLAPFKLELLEKDQKNEVHSKLPIEDSEIGVPSYRSGNEQPRLVLIEGAAGIGKTTFSEKFCYKWSQGKLLSSHTLLLLLPLRDNRVRTARNVRDLFQYAKLEPAIAEEVESTKGEGVALWLEAWDELGEETRNNKGSIFWDLISGRVLPSATIVITSRPWATECLRMDSKFKVDQHIEIVSTPDIQYNRILRSDEVRNGSRAEFIDYVLVSPSMKAALHAPATANIVADIFQWSIETGSPPPTTMTQLYSAFTCKLLTQHLSKNSPCTSLEEVPADVKKKLHKICELAWEGILKQQLIFSSNDVGGDTLGLLEAVSELHVGKDSLLSIQLTLQEFLSAYHITLLPLVEQKQVIRENDKTDHLKNVIRFYFGLSQLDNFTSEMIAEHLSMSNPDATVFHWLFEAGETTSKELRSESQRKIRLAGTSNSWTPLDYYVLGYSVAHYQFKWKLNCRASTMGDLELEMLTKGMESCTLPEWNGNIKCEFRANEISPEGLEKLRTIPEKLAQQILTVNVGFNKLLDSDALISFCDLIPRLKALKTFSLQGIPSIGKSGAVEKFSSILWKSDIPVKRLGLSNTNLDEDDCAELTQLIANTELERLHLSQNSLSSTSVASIMQGVMQKCTIQLLNMAGSTFSEENCKTLGSLLVQPGCQLTDLNLVECQISDIGAKHLAEALAKNDTLTALYLSRNPLGDVGAKAFGATITKNTALETLHMADCKINSPGCIQLAEGLKKNVALQKLDISNNHLEEGGAKALGEALIKNMSLIKLNISGSDSVPWEGLDRLLKSLDNNSKLEELFLSQQLRVSSADKRVKWY